MKKIYTFLAIALSISASKAQNIPVDFEPAGYGATWTWTCFENDVNPSLEIVANPSTSGLNPSATVAKFTALQAGNPWAGCETQHGSDIGTFDITSSNSIIRIMVYKTKISNVGIKLVTNTAASLGEILVPNTVINQWEQLTFDFSAHIGGMTYDQLVIFPDFVARPADDIIYFDNIFGEAAALGTEEQAQTNISIAPNPTENELTITSDLAFDQIEIFNMLGERVLEFNNTPNSFPIDLSSLENGLFIVKMRQGNYVSVQKVNKI
ncbi:MAG: T9SS type A sorting domain-containing protein [Crocinitomicaceae bacterium]